MVRDNDLIRKDRNTFPSLRINYASTISSCIYYQILTYKYGPKKERQISPEISHSIIEFEG